MGSNASPRTEYEAGVRGSNTARRLRYTGQAHNGFVDSQRNCRAQCRALGDRLNFQEWKDIYRKLVHWELELERSNEDGMSEICLQRITGFWQK